MKARVGKPGCPKYYLAVSVAFLTFLVYLSALQNAFLLWDDNSYVFENPHIRSLDLAFFKWAFFDFYAANWHPLTWISHALDYAIWGLDPLGHHLTNNILHAVNTFLVVLLVVRLMEVANPFTIHDSSASVRTQADSPGRTDPPGAGDSRFTLIAAGVTGLLFGLHPLHVESVAWVAERKDLLCGLFYLLSVMAYSGYVCRGGPVWPPKEGQPHRVAPTRTYIFSLAFFVLALMSKPMAVSLPVVLLILDWYPFQRVTSLKTFRRAFVGKIPFIVLSIISSILTVLAQKEAIVPIEFVPLTSRVLVGIESLADYLWKMILPVHLTPYYPYPKDVSLLSFEYFGALVLVAGLTAACLIIVRKQKLWLSAWGYYAITLLPVLGIVQVGAQAMADRYTYLPSLGPFLIIGVVMAWSSSRVKIWRPAIRLFSVAVTLFIFVCLAYLTFGQISVWRNSIRLWSNVIEREPMKVPFAYSNRGLAFDRAGQYNKAIEDYDKAITLNPSDHEAYNNRGMAFEKLDQLARAIEDFGSAIVVKPAYYQAYYNRAIVFERIGQYDRAVEDYDKTIALNPSYTEAYNNRGIVFDKMGRYNKAIEDYDKAIVLNPSHFEAYYNLGIVYGKTALLDKAVEAFSRAIAINPNYPYAYGSRGLAYSHLGRLDSALNDLNRALALDHNYARAYVYRGKLYLKTGGKELAVPDFQKACNLGDDEGCQALKLTH